MRIESVVAHSFGPFLEHRLELGQGMTVIHGPNESGKSSWHAALYVGLCGIRRAPGRRADEREFRARHRPWSGENWEVSTVVTLADGRRVELRHDLDGKVACHAHDADLGRDYSQEIIFEGAPDGSRWLGLDRRTFLSTACVGQADIQLSKDQVGALQEHLQRAAATAGADATAAAAITRIDNFRRDFVGTDRRNATKPLRLATEQLDLAQSKLVASEEQHRDYLRLQGEIEELEGSLNIVLHTLQAVQAAQARELANIIQRQASRARELTVKHPTAPQDPLELRQQVQDVGTVLGIWENCPSVIAISPPTSQDLRREIEDLPPMPDGDTSPHSSVVEGVAVYRSTYSNLGNLQSHMPPQPEDVEVGGLTPEEIRHLATELALEEPEADPVVDGRVEQARSKLEAMQEPETRRDNRRSVSPFLWPFAFLWRILGKLLRPLFGGRKQTVDYAGIARASEELRQAEAAQGEIRIQREAVRQRRETARNTALEKGLPVTYEELISLATSAEQAMGARNLMARWQDEHQGLQGQYEDAKETLTGALKSRGVSADSDLLDAVETYGQDCEFRRNQAEQAAKKAELERALEVKKEQETIAAEADRGRNEANGELARVALAIGVTADTEEELAEAIRLWLESTEGLIREREQSKDEWRELQELLNGQNLSDLEEASERKSRESGQLVSLVGEETVEGVELGEDPEGLLDQRRLAVEDSQTTLAMKRGEFEQFSRNMSSVAEAEEEIENAKAEMSRVTTLDQTLAKTRELLAAAQDRVHRSLAPVLRDALKPWLNNVTHGRYQDVRVDVESLEVTVSGDGKNWREASRLSHGTAEQIYLLLRVLMTRYLTKDGEMCPLILDDVTVHCDPGRQEAVLSLLHEISGEQQVILFSQEPETLDWALEHLSGEDDCLIQLDPQLVPA